MLNNISDKAKTALVEALWLTIAILINIGFFVYWIKFATTPTEVVSPLSMAGILLGACSYIIMGNLVIGQRKPLLNAERRFIFSLSRNSSNFIFNKLRSSASGRQHQISNSWLNRVALHNSDGHIHVFCCCLCWYSNFHCSAVSHSQYWH